MSHKKRNLIGVDPEIRKNIIVKIVFYWSACLVFASLPLIIGKTLGDSDWLFVDHIGDLGKRFWPLYVITMGIVPFAIRDALRLANRTLGPLARLRAELKRFERTGHYNPVLCREDDFLHELISEINQAIASNQAAQEDSELAGTSA